MEYVREIIFDVTLAKHDIVTEYPAGLQISVFQCHIVLGFIFSSPTQPLSPGEVNQLDFLLVIMPIAHFKDKQAISSRRNFWVQLNGQFCMMQNLLSMF